MRSKTKISIFYTKTVILSFLLGLFCPCIHAQVSWDKERQAAAALVTEESVREEVEFLSDSLCQGRAAGSEGARRAAGRIAERFSEAGLDMFGDSWEMTFTLSRDLKGCNVAGMLAGSKSIPCDRYVIIGAHYDHLGIIGGKMYPGADSNASGIAAMTSLAEMFGAMRRMGRILESNIIFVAFDARESGLKGSESFWNMIEYGRLTDPVTGKVISKDKIDLMVNIDQIGSSLAPITKGRRDYLLMLGTSSLDRSRRGLLKECNKACGTDMEIGLDYYGSANFTKVFYRLSDQRHFVENKIPTVLFTSGITMNNNKTWDTPDSLDYEVLRKRIVLMFHWLEKITDKD